MDIEKVGVLTMWCDRLKKAQRQLDSIVTNVLQIEFFFMMYNYLNVFFWT